MNKRIVIVFALMLVSLGAWAIPAYRGTFKYRQPDGSVIELRRHGDEYFHWTTDLNGQVVSLDRDGYYRPSVLDKTQKKRASLRRSAARTRQAAARVGNGNAMTRGQRHIPVILVSFQDKNFTVNDPKTKFNNLLNQQGYSYNGGNGSVRDFYKDNSHGVFEPVFDVYGPVKLPNNMAYYGADEDEADAYKAVVDGAKLLDGEIDFSQYDADNDGYVDMILLYYAGFNEAEGGPEESIWPHQYTVNGQGGQFDGKLLDAYFCTSELSGSEGSTLCPIGTTAHEFGHSLGLPDFYDTDYEDNGQAGALYDFSLMCSGSYNDDGNTPPHFNAIERQMLGWMQEEDVIELQEGENAIPAIYKDVAYKLSTDVEGEFFLLETRDGSSWDKPLATGLVIYHVDQSTQHMVSIGTGRDTKTVSANYLWTHWEYDNAINENGSHPCFYVIPSGDPGNLWYHYDYRYGGEVYQIDEDSKKMVFPGQKRVKQYTPVTWDKHELGKTLVNISYTASTSTSYVTLVQDGVTKDYYSIDCASTYKVGDKLALALIEAEKDKASSVSWKLDGKAVSGSVTFSAAGTYTLEAQLGYADGRKEVIEALIVVK